MDRAAFEYGVVLAWCAVVVGLMLWNFWRLWRRR